MTDLNVCNLNIQKSIYFFLCKCYISDLFQIHIYIVYTDKKFSIFMFLVTIKTTIGPKKGDPEDVGIEIEQKNTEIYI